MNHKKLKEVLKERQVSYEQLCVELHCSYNTLSSRMAGRTEFTVLEANILSRVLKLSDEEIINIFFREES